MNKCLKIMLTLEPREDFLHNIVQKYARKYNLEGLAQSLGQNKIKIIVCGKKDQVDFFVDMMHKESPKENIEDIEVEPFLKDKDYRGVFRIIE